MVPLFRAGKVEVQENLFDELQQLQVEKEAASLDVTQSCGELREHHTVEILSASGFCQQFRVGSRMTWSGAFGSCRRQQPLRLQTGENFMQLFFIFLPQMVERGAGDMQPQAAIALELRFRKELLQRG